jgi:arabinofuranosyltransferase
VVQLLYYVVVVGGDHFEYRVLSHLIAPALVAFLWMLNAAAVRGRIACVLMVVLLLLGLPLPWSHWALSHRLETRPATYHMKVAVAPHWPAGVRWYAELFDRLQFWLIDHWVCVRHQEHKVFWQWYSGLFPTRVQGSQLPPQDFPVLAAASVGIPGWVLPRINILDAWGLNDYVIARSPSPSGTERMMAHEGVPPAGYIEAFEPNVVLVAPGSVVVRPREPALTADQIRATESEWARSLTSRAP